jgi:hypothetical protein
MKWPILFSPFRAATTLTAGTELQELLELDYNSSVDSRLLEPGTKTSKRLTAVSYILYTVII